VTMKCSKVVGLLGKYLDKEFPRVEALEVYNHLLTCQSCAREFRALKRDKDIVQQAFSRNPFDSTLSDAIYQRLIWSGATVLPRRQPPIFVRYAPVWAACAAVVLVAVILASLPRPPVPSTNYTVAKVQEGSALSVVRGTTAESSELGGDRELLNGESVKNVSASPASFITLAGSRVTLKPGTSVQLAGSGGTVKITLLSGEVYAEVLHEPLKIVTDEAVVVVKGTKFSVKREGEATTVTVAEGEVICLAPNNVVTITQGFQIVVTGEGLSGPASVDIASVADWIGGAQQPTKPASVQPVVAPTQPEPGSSAPPVPEPPVDQPHKMRK